MYRNDSSDPKKKFDCVEMKRKAQERHYEATKHMTREEKYSYWKQKEEVFLKEKKALDNLSKV